MFKRLFVKLFFYTVVSLMLICTHVLVAVAVIEKERIANYFSSIASPEQKKAVVQFLKKDGQVHAGIPIPDSMLSQDKEKDEAFARSFLSSQRKWVYVMTHPEYGHKVFIFRALADDEEPNQ